MAKVSVASNDKQRGNDGTVSSGDEGGGYRKGTLWEKPSNANAGLTGD